MALLIGLSALLTAIIAALVACVIACVVLCSAAILSFLEIPNACLPVFLFSCLPYVTLLSF